jgi:hypothetical protein
VPLLPRLAESPVGLLFSVAVSRLRIETVKLFLKDRFREQRASAVNVSRSHPGRQL